eukprot:4990365-Prymnesium_polylepis.1
MRLDIARASRRPSLVLTLWSCVIRFILATLHHRSLTQSPATRRGVQITDCRLETPLEAFRQWAPGQ